MTRKSGSSTDKFLWQPQTAAAGLVRREIASLAESSPALVKLASRLVNETGTRLIDWVDHLVLGRGADAAKLAEELQAAGFASHPREEPDVWRHLDGIFPAIVLTEASPRRLAIKVDAVDEFVAAQRLGDFSVEGAEGGQFRLTVFAREGDTELAVVERKGYSGFVPPEHDEARIAAAAEHRAAFESRARQFDPEALGFDHASRLIAQSIVDLGVDWTCDLFFAAERNYWQSRNRAGQAQKSRQDALGLGWGNHDHHTYRSSRDHFTRLIAVLQQLGMRCRERFYAGAEAGWGAQVLEQPVCQVTVFADVDLEPDELARDFAHAPLPPLAALGTIGLWCTLHGEAFLEAGMHHLECQFDFDAAREQLASIGIETMAPFTDLPHLKQAFTAAEVWTVADTRINAARVAGWIDDSQAAQFQASGALGSHLEILERNDGYKGFNQTGISQIIRATDPRAC
ncbi:MAG: hypothetical protein DWQ31_05150 [Planctomycetota bacterium]|nr:MAG: hypothetical protein DWQ31_05150 [Planctomycetota bacterium]REJ97578.1 MAG: hypothetical protein DWQ35_01560 [Planctomycetota bacterium]